MPIRTFCDGCGREINMGVSSFCEMNVIKTNIATQQQPTQSKVYACGSCLIAMKAVLKEQALKAKENKDDKA